MQKWFALIVVALTSLMFGSAYSYAEEGAKVKAEDLVEQPQAVSGEQELSLAPTKRAKLTEEQALTQLKYMMVAGFKRVEPQLLDNGSFKPMGMTLDPDGNFRAIKVDGQDEMPQELAVQGIVQALKGLAANRTQWAVGLIYVTGNQNEDGGVDRRIVVIAEHIAGWARSWHYPYAVTDGQVKMAQPAEFPMTPVYYAR